MQDRSRRPDSEHLRSGDAAELDEAELDEEVDEASDESFPASDAPQWWSGPPSDRTDD
jgi:hypothetical protein